MCRDLKLVEVADQKCKFFCIKKLGVVVVNRRSRKSELDEQNKRKKSFFIHVSLLKSC